MPINVPDFRPGAAVAEKDDEKLAGQFGLTGSPLSGQRSPDAIDRPANVLNITTSVGVQSLPPEQMAMLQAQLHRAGLLPSTYRPSGTLDDDTRNALTELKQQASSSGMSDLETLRTVIETRAQTAAGAYGADLADGSSGGAVSQKRTVVSTQSTEPILTDPVTARAVLRDTLAQRLGRAPDADEYHRFRKLLSNSESGQDVATTTNKYGKSGRLRSTSTTHSDDTTDPSAAVLADEFSRRGKLGREANTHMIATDYYDVVENLMGG